MSLHTGIDEKPCKQNEWKKWPKLIGDCKAADQGVRGK
jgi:hypothetical protein